MTSNNDAPAVVHHLSRRQSAEGHWDTSKGERSILLLALGSDGIGKKSLWNRLTHGGPDGGDLALYDPTGPDQDPTQFSCGGYRLYLQYTTILVPEFYAYAEVQPFDSFGVILAYDPQSRESWEQVSQIHQRFQRRFAERESLPFQVLVLGLKADVEDGQRQVTRKEADQFSTLHAYRFAECSARSGAGVREVFELFVLDAYNATITPGRSPAAETRNAIRTAAAALNDTAPVLVQNNDSGTGRNRD